MNPKNITVAVTVSALLALAYAGGTYNAAGNKLAVSDHAVEPIEIVAVEKSAFASKLSGPDSCGASGPVSVAAERDGKVLLTDGGTCGFWIDAADVAAVAAEAGVEPGALRLDMRGGKLVALP